MLKWIFLALKGLFGGFIAQALLGAGLSVVSFAGLSVLITGMLNAVVSQFSSLPTDILNILLLGGIGPILSAIGSGMLTRIAITSTTLGIKKAAS